MVNAVRNELDELTEQDERTLRSALARETQFLKRQQLLKAIWRLSDAEDGEANEAPQPKRG